MAGPADADAPTDAGATHDGSLVVLDAGPGPTDAAADTAEDAAQAFCDDECAQNPPICANEYRGWTDRCIPHCIELYLAQARDNARGCPQGEYHLVECLAEHLGACEDVELECREEWHKYGYCED